MDKGQEVLKLTIRAGLFLAILVFMFFMSKYKLWQNNGQLFYLVLALLAWANGHTFKAIEALTDKIVSK